MASPISGPPRSGQNALDSEAQRVTPQKQDQPVNRPKPLANGLPSSPTPKRTASDAVTISAAARAISMYRSGDTVSQIAAALGLPLEIVTIDLGLTTHTQSSSTQASTPSQDAQASGQGGSKTKG
jgi:hypothetical protein